jgi:hypothetical protein
MYFLQHCQQIGFNNSQNSQMSLKTWILTKWTNVYQNSTFCKKKCWELPLKSILDGGYERIITIDILYKLDSASLYRVSQKKLTPLLFIWISNVSVFFYSPCRSFSLTWSVAPVGWWNNTKYLNKKELIPVPYTNMAAISLFWYTNMAAVTSDENDLLVKLKPRIFQRLPPFEYMAAMLEFPTR